MLVAVSPPTWTTRLVPCSACGMWPCSGPAAGIPARRPRTRTTPACRSGGCPARCWARCARTCRSWSGGRWLILPSGALCAAVRWSRRRAACGGSGAAPAGSPSSPCPLSRWRGRWPGRRTRHVLRRSRPRVWWRTGVGWTCYSLKVAW